MNGTLLEEVLLALRQLLDSDELEAVRKVEIEGHDVFVTIEEEAGGCRRCKRTAREVRTALEIPPPRGSRLRSAGERARGFPGRRSARLIVVALTADLAVVCTRSMSS